MEDCFSELYDAVRKLQKCVVEDISNKEDHISDLNTKITKLRKDRESISIKLLKKTTLCKALLDKLSTGLCTNCNSSIAPPKIEDIDDLLQTEKRSISSADVSINEKCLDNGEKEKYLDNGEELEKSPVINRISASQAIIHFEKPPLNSTPKINKPRSFLSVLQMNSDSEFMKPFQDVSPLIKTSPGEFSIRSDAKQHSQSSLFSNDLSLEKKCVSHNSDEELEVVDSIWLPSKSENIIEDVENTFDALPTKSPAAHKFEQVTRAKEARRQLRGFECKECEDYYATMSEEQRKERIGKCSRHRRRHSPPKTPANFWDIDFPPTPQNQKTFKRLRKF